MPEQACEQSGGSPRSGAEKRRRRFSLAGLLRTRLVAGLLTAIPIWVTVTVIKFVFDLMRSATGPAARRIAETLAQSPEERVADTFNAYIGWIEPILAVSLTLFILYLLGLLTASVFGRRLISLAEAIVERLPLIKTIYRSTKQIVSSLGGGQSMKFQRVVLVEFPRPGMKCIGFLTAVMKDADTGRDMATVFISTTPNPTTGYMQILPLDQVSETGWTVEEAVKLLMSGGILSPKTVPFDTIHPIKVDDLSAERDAAKASAGDRD